MNIDLITGGAGFIGSHLAETLTGKGRKVRVVDNLSTGRMSNLEGLSVEFLKGDVSDPTVAREACSGVERIFHMAARPSVPWSVEFPEEAFNTNHGTTLALIDAATEAGTRRLVFSSTCALYGDNPELPKKEGMTPEPVSPYGEHKLMGERALAQAHAAGKVEAICLRYFNVYGPRQDPSSPYSGVISLFTRWALDGKAPNVFGDGNQTRDFVYVGDVIRANLLAMDAEVSQPGTITNIATGSSISVLDLWKSICEAGDFPILEANHLPAREGDVLHSVADVQRAKEILGFTAQVPLAEGLRTTITAER
jgi:UDP-glucose 4-epimerase